MLLRNLGTLALAASLALSACSSDDPEPKVAPDPSPSTSAAVASPSDEAGASSPEDAVRAWVAARNQALRTGDTSQVRELGTQCGSCEGVLDSIDDVYAAGGRFETTGWSVKSTKLRRSNGRTATVDAAIVIRPGRTYSSAGAAPVDYPLERSIVVFRLTNDDDSWQVSFIGFLS